MRTSTMVAASTFIATLAPTIIAAPIVPSEFNSGLVELSEREPFLPLLGLAAGAIGSLFGGRKRDLGDDRDLAEREPFFPKSIEDKVSQRDLGDNFELVEREPFLPLLGLAASAIGSLFSGRKRDLGDDLDLVEREPFDPLYLPGWNPALNKPRHSAIIKRDLNDFALYARDDELDLSERMVFHGNPVRLVPESFLNNQQRNLEDLELELRHYLGELEARDSDDYSPLKSHIRTAAPASTLHELD